MLDNQWSIWYGGAEYVWGTPATPVVNAAAPDLGDVEVLAADEPVPRGDGRRFGTDLFAGRTVTFDLAVLGSSETAVRSETAALAVWWRADKVRSTPGAVAELRSRYRGVERVAYGRPRRFSADLKAAKSGAAVVVADFACADDRWYDLVEKVTSVPIVPAAGGGLVTPLATPLTSTQSSNRSTSFTVGGQLPAWPVIEVVGPITGPVVEVVGLWRVELSVTVPDGQTLTVDTRPWARTVLLGSGSAAGSLARSSARLSQASLPPGVWELVLRGVSTPGTAVARLRWRDSYPTP